MWWVGGGRGIQTRGRVPVDAIGKTKTDAPIGFVIENIYTARARLYRARNRIYSRAVYTGLTGAGRSGGGGESGERAGNGAGGRKVE